MNSVARPRVERGQIAILFSLALVTVASWFVVVRQANGSMESMGLTIGMGAWIFLATWVAMMAAMMFPAAAPMIVTFARIHAGKRERAEPFVPTWVFVAGYLAVWTVAGAIAYLAARLAEDAAGRWMWLDDNAGRIGGGLLVLAGLYQLTPAKHACLNRCRTPLQFVMTSWRSGYRGALRMGVEHGGYCLGCCWMLFAIMFPLGIMNVALMAGITLLVFAEKVLPGGERVAKAVAVALVAYGLVVVGWPGVLPGTGGGAETMTM